MDRVQGFGLGTVGRGTDLVVSGEIGHGHGLRQGTRGRKRLPYTERSSGQTSNSACSLSILHRIDG